MKAHTRTYWRKKAVELAKQIARAEGVCLKCGRTKEQGWQMHGAHVIPTTYAATCADVANIICLCAGCHNMGSHSWHHDPVAFGRWFDTQFPGRYDTLWVKARAITKPDFEAIYHQLLKIQKSTP